MKYTKLIAMLLSLLACSYAIDIENGDSKLEIRGFLNIYMDTGDDIGDIGDAFTAKDMVSGLKLSFTHKESEELTSIGYLSMGVDTTTEYGSNDLFLQKYLTYIGLQHKVWGTVYLGTMTSVNYTLTGWTDMGLPHSGSGHSIWDEGDEGAKRGIGYAEDAIFYTKNFKFSDSQSLDILLETQAAENNFTQEGSLFDGGVRRKSGNAAGFIYNIGKISFGVTESFATLEGNEGSTYTEFTINELAFAARYQGEKLYFAFSATSQENLSALDTNNVGIEFAADWKIGSGYGLLSIYNLRKISGGSAASAEANKGLNDVNYLTITGYKLLSDQFKIYMEVKMDLRTSEERDLFIGTHDMFGFENTNDNAISIGLQYTF